MQKEDMAKRGNQDDQSRRKDKRRSNESVKKYVVVVWHRFLQRLKV